MENEKFDKEFDDLISGDRLNINSLEKIMSKDIEEYKKGLRKHVEELLKNKIDENKLIAKKNKNGKKRGMN